MDVVKEVKKYYGESLKKTTDLKTDVCTNCKAPPQKIKDILQLISDEVLQKYYGCGLCIPLDFSLLEGAKVLDLGCGAGRDVYLLSKLVGENGFVCGLDMTEEMLETALKFVDYQTEKYAYSKPNVEFRQGVMEDLTGLDDAAFDLIVSNCVVNLSANKSAVLEEAFRVLREGGEFYFSDVYADRRIPKALQENSVLWGECISGAMYRLDFEAAARKAGFLSPRVVESNVVKINSKLEALVGPINFTSCTYRLVKAAGLEERCEDYGQAVMYKGTIAEFPFTLKYDLEHVFPAHKVYPLCRNTFRMLNSSRFSSHFDFFDSSTHFGLFDCNKGSRNGGGGGDCGGDCSSNKGSRDGGGGGCC